MMSEYPRAGPDDVASRLVEDYLQKGMQEGSATVLRSLPQLPAHGDPVDSLIRQHELLRSLGPRLSSRERAVRLGKGSWGGETLPQPGDQLFGFRLRSELGRGAFARVFLAEQTDLAARPVVLKVSAIEGNEPQTLAQLQHTHIVPVFSLHEDRDAGLRALCMPYFGGASLAQVLGSAWAGGVTPTTGAELADALGRVAAPRSQGSEVRGQQSGGASLTPDSCLLTPEAQRLRRLSYVQAVAWLGACLAEGLQHAHSRGVLHRDLKPSNVLLSADGQPMLLDFNLAQDSRDGCARASLGGTVAYMAPEHLRALVGHDPALDARVDRRSDIYSLGMVISEMLVGRRPFAPNASYDPLPVLVKSMAVERSLSAPSARALRPDVPWGLESILRRCMAPDPEDRYQHAEELAEDLRRLLADQPLRHAPELSLAEQARKWVRRHPRLASSAGVCAAAVVLLALAGVTLAGLSGRLARTSEKLVEVRAPQRKRQYEMGLARALFLVNTRTELEDHLREGLSVCEDTLGLYGVLERPDWQDHPDWAWLKAEDRHRLAGDTRELLLLLAGARVRLAPGDRNVLTGALALLDRAEAIPTLPPCRALWEDRAVYREQLGDAQGAAQARERGARVLPAGVRDHYLLALTHARAGRPDRALVHLDE